jgi:hypothetical protein
MKWSLLIVLLTCFGQSVFGQRYQQQDNLYYEVPDSISVKNKNFFNLDNQIYKPGIEFKFSYQIIKNGDTLLVRVDKMHDTKTSTWTFVKQQNADSLTIRYLSFKILEGYGGLDQLFPDYSQTIIQQNYYSANQLLFEGTTGLIENIHNIWLHPFRGKYFSVLEFSPFPYIKFPATTSFKWTWALNDISERWSDDRIIEYKGKQQSQYEYEITGTKNLNTAFGRLNCIVIEASARTSLGNTKLTSYFNKEYGFVSLDYLNIDSSIIKLELINRVE